MQRSKQLHPSQRAQIHALELGIKALTDWRRKNYAMGEAAYKQGIRADHFDDGEFSGDPFAWVEQGHAHYVEYSRAIQELEDMIEIIQDPGITIEQEKLL